MNCYIIEDDKIQQKLLLNHISKIGNLNVIGIFDSALDLKEKILNDQPDLIFLDIELPEMSGVEFLNETFLPEKTKVIMVTSSKDYALDGYENDVVDYLLKPVSFERFEKSLDKVNKLKKIATINEYLFVRSNGADVKLFFKDILWVQSASEYVIIHTINGKHMVYSNMNSILKKLSNKFIRVHRSNIVNIEKIDKIHGNMIEIDKTLIKVSKSYKKELELISM